MIVTLSRRTELVLDEARRRGYLCTVEDASLDRCRVEKNGRGFRFEETPGLLSFHAQPDPDALMRKDAKIQALCSEDLPVPRSWGTYDGSDGLKAMRAWAFPLVAKPVIGSFSANVHTDLRTVAAVVEAVDAIVASGEEAYVESHVDGDHYRALVIDGRYVGCVERRAANVTGDGRSTIRELIERRNSEPCRGTPDERWCTNHHLLFDDVSARLLAAKGLEPSSVLPAGYMLKIQSKITAATGADYIDVTDDLHPDTVERLERFAQTIGAITLGFDIISKDITRTLETTNGAINEFNYCPYIDLNENCNVGTRRPASGMLWDALERRAGSIITPSFPEF